MGYPSAAFWSSCGAHTFNVIGSPDAELDAACPSPSALELPQPIIVADNIDAVKTSDSIFLIFIIFPPYIFIKSYSWNRILFTL